MERKLINIDLGSIPSEFHSLMENAEIYDSSCSADARVIYIEKDDGYFLKTSAKGTLDLEAKMTSFFHSKGLAAEVLGFVSSGKDWLLTRRVPGEDCTFHRYLADPVVLCDTFADILRNLHETEGGNCPVKDRTGDYLVSVETGFKQGRFDASIFADYLPFSDASAAWKYLQENAGKLKNDTLIHGDYCLPNVILNDGKFSGFIDLGNSGMGDRHIDLFWGAWTLWYNLKTFDYTDRFFDAYGRDEIDMEILKIVMAAEVFG